MKRLAAAILVAAGTAAMAQTAPPTSKPQERPKSEAPAAAAKAQEKPAAQAEKPAAATQAQPATEAAPAAPAEVKGPEEKGLAFIDLLAKGQFTSTVNYVGPQYHLILSPGKLQFRWRGLEERLGKLKNKTVTHTELAGDKIQMNILLEFQKGTANALLTYSAKAKDDLLTGVQFTVLEIAPKE